MTPNREKTREEVGAGSELVGCVVRRDAMRSDVLGWKQQQLGTVQLCRQLCGDLCPSLRTKRSYDLSALAAAR